MEQSTWRPYQGERIYLSHAITSHNFKSCNFIRWWGGCLIVFFDDELHRIHVRHSAVKRVIKSGN